MTRKFRIPGLALVVIFAIVGIEASSASEEATFFAEKAPITLTGSPSNTLQITAKAGTVECEAATFEEKLEATELEEIELTPTFEECEMAGGGIVKIDRNGCKFYARATFPPLHGGAGLRCPPGKDIKVTIFGFCVLTIKPGGIGTVKFNNKGEKSSRDVEMIWEPSEMHYVQEGSTCPGNEGSSEKTFTNGAIHGTTTLKGESGKEQVGFWVE